MFFIFVLGISSCFSHFLISSCNFISDFKKQFIVRKVIDGDTIQLDNNDIIRLLGIDTPETYDSNNNFAPTSGSQYFYGLLAKKYVLSKVLNKKIKVQKIKKDKYNRYIGRVQIDEKDLSIMLVQNGLAIVRYLSNNKKSPFYYYDKNYVSTINNVEKQAKELRIGFWKENLKKLKDIYPTHNFS